MVQVIKSIVIYFCSHIELAQTMLRKTVVAFFIATIYINTAYAQELSSMTRIDGFPDGMVLKS